MYKVMEMKKETSVSLCVSIYIRIFVSSYMLTYVHTNIRFFVYIHCPKYRCRARHAGFHGCRIRQPSVYVMRQRTTGRVRRTIRPVDRYNLRVAEKHSTIVESARTAFNVFPGDGTSKRPRQNANVCAGL